MIVLSALRDVPPESVALFFSGVIGIIALILIPAEIRLHRKARSWPRAVATVTRMGLTRSDMNGTWGPATSANDPTAGRHSSVRYRPPLRPSVTFRTNLGETRTIVLPYASTRSLKLGDAIEVIYDPERPDKVLPARRDGGAGVERGWRILLLPFIVIACAAVWWAILF